MSTKQQPGMMIYFEDYRALASSLNHEQLGRLFASMLEYAETGAIPEPEEDPMVRFGFAFMRTKLDRDTERYREVSWKRQYAAYCREQEKRGVLKLPYEQWSKCLIANDIKSHQTHPTTTTTASPTASPTTTTTTSSSSSPTATAEQGDPYGYGPMGNNQEEMRRLIQRLKGEDTEECGD